MASECSWNSKFMPCCCFSGWHTQPMQILNATLANVYIFVVRHIKCVIMHGIMLFNAQYSTICNAYTLVASLYGFSIISQVSWMLIYSVLTYIAFSSVCTELNAICSVHLGFVHVYCSCLYVLGISYYHCHIHFLKTIW